MADIKPIKPIKLCVNITIPTIDDDSISLYECVGILGNKLQEAIQKINESLGSLEGAYTADNPPPYPVTSVNGKTGAVVIDIPANVYTEDNPPPYPVTSVNRAETKDVITVFEPEGGSIEDVSQAELIAACKAGARLGAFNQDDGTCRLYHFNLYIDPERVDYNEVAGGGASGVISVNNQTGAVNIFNAPISAATAESVTALNTSTITKINQLKDDKLDKTSTAADSSKLGGKAPEYYLQPRNLLDNSYWENLKEVVNQRGETSKQGDWVYWIDRWQVNASNAAISLVDGGIRVTAQVGKNQRLVQKVPLEKIQKGRAYTIAVCESDGTVRCASGIYNGNISGDGNGDNLIYVTLQDGDGSTFYYFIVDCYKDVVLKWAALYEGAYTADTLPPYVPKGYTAELAECQRYYQNYNILGIVCASSVEINQSYYRGSFIFPAMRLTPTITNVELNTDVPDFFTEYNSEKTVVFGSNIKPFVVKRVNLSADL